MRAFLFTAIFLLSVLLNFYQLDKNPPGLYIDEISIGVNAYSILTKGIDEYGIKYPLYFKAYGEYKLPVYIYLTSLSMKIFGKNEFAVRFPSAFLGVMTLVPFFLILKKLSKSKNLPLLATFLLSVNPWFMHFVGPAFEATVALFFFVNGIYFYILFKESNRFLYLFTSILSLLFTIYTYNSYKVITPITLVFFFLSLIKEKSRKLSFWSVFIICFLLIIQSIIFNPSNVRFAQASAFVNNSPTNIIYFLRNYISYFSLDFLFNSGDGINRHQFLNFGVLARWTLPFLLLGLYRLLNEKASLLKNLTFAILLISPIPASFALPSPHTLRSLLMVIPLVLIISVGILFLLNNVSKFYRLSILMILCFFVYEFSSYLHYGYFHYPKTALLDWGGNFKEVAMTAKKLGAHYPLVAVHESLPFTAEYLRFYAENVTPFRIHSDAEKKLTLGNNKVLLITSDTTGGTKPSDKLIDTVYLPNDNKNIFAQFWEI